MINKNTGGKSMIIAVILLLFHAGLASATKIELGSLPGNNVQTIYPGDEGTFTVEFFNMGEDPISLTSEVVYDRELGVEVAPRSIILDNEVTTNDTAGHKSWLIINDGKTYVRLYQVKVYVYVPDEVSKKTYKIKLVSTGKSTDSLDAEGYAQTMAQTREFTFTVNTIRTSSAGGGDEEEEEEIEYDTGPERENIRGDDGGYTSDKEGGRETGGGDTVYPEITGTTQAGRPTQPSTPSSGGSGGLLGISQDNEGNTNIDLPVGQVVLDKQQTETVIDIGLITLIVSVLSLAVRVIR